jgi:chloride channel 3/4/5
MWAQTRRIVGHGQSWFIVTLVGVSPALLHINTFLFQRWPSLSPFSGAFIGVNAAFISILTEWLSDLRRGYCSEGWWLNQQFCCWEIEEVDAEGACAAWIPWSNFTPGNWIVYVLLAVRLFL